MRCRGYTISSVPTKATDEHLANICGSQNGLIIVHTTCSRYICKMKRENIGVVISERNHKVFIIDISTTAKCHDRTYPASCMSDGFIPKTVSPEVVAVRA